MNRSFSSAVTSLLLVALITLSLSPSVFADHAWGSYHWARTANPFTVKVVDSNTSNWDDALSKAIGDWSRSNVMDVVRENGDNSTRTRKQCKMVSGKIRSCNAAYGYNGWLGLATINISGTHITQATSKMNDSYLASSSYSSTNRQHVMCQEIGHGFGLGHQDESGADLNTCMDYSSNLDNPEPNTHDYNMLQAIYSHLDSTTTLKFSTSVGRFFGDDPDAPYNWGRLIRQSQNGRASVYREDHPDGSFTIRHVLWTQEFAERCQGCDHRWDH